MQVFVIINNVEMMIYVDANVKNWLIKDIFRILVITSVNVINRVMLVSICIIKPLSAEKDW